MINIYFNQNYHNTFNEWFQEFLEITNIKSFNKDKGIDFYNYKNNNIIMIYTIEKLDLNKEYLINLLKIENFRNVNNKSNDKIYNEVKNKIEYKKEYLDNLLNTDIMNIFYTEEDINKFYSKYKISD